LGIERRKTGIMSTPAGWYPQPDGQQRYWDGQQWTENFAPGVSPGAPEGIPSETAPGAARRNWFLRHKVLTAIGAVLLLGIFSSLGSLGTKSEPVADVATNPVATTQAPNQSAEDLAAAQAADKVAADKAAADKVVADTVAVAKAAADKVVADTVAAAKAAAAKAAAAAAAKKAAAPQLGKTVRDGKFAFTVTAIKCGIAQVGSNDFLTQKAQGMYCRASLTVENIGDEAQTMFASNQYLFDTKGRKFSADATANIYDESAKLMFDEINPGNSLKGFVYFDVPKATKVSKLELHDSMFSGGIEVRL
jgi:hypothetical protein